MLLNSQVQKLSKAKLQALYNICIQRVASTQQIEIQKYQDSFLKDERQQYAKQVREQINIDNLLKFSNRRIVAGSEEIRKPKVAYITSLGYFKTPEPIKPGNYFETRATRINLAGFLIRQFINLEDKLKFSMERKYQELQEEHEKHPIFSKKLKRKDQEEVQRLIDKALNLDSKRFKKQLHEIADQITDVYLKK